MLLDSMPTSMGSQKRLVKLARIFSISPDLQGAGIEFSCLPLWSGLTRRPRKFTQMCWLSSKLCACRRKWAIASSQQSLARPTSMTTHPDVG
ncbi:hypothetical protein HZ326_12069 [Fusarium oxysporum f. sp. albedinis]|nr:hypothetical protein HZ326_12069 [Fusarium oxysporum f. sp. albedinis]